MVLNAKGQQIPRNGHPTQLCYLKALQFDQDANFVPQFNNFEILL